MSHIQSDTANNNGKASATAPDPAVWINPPKATSAMAPEVLKITGVDTNDLH